MRRAGPVSMGTPAQPYRPARAGFVGSMVTIALALFGLALLWVDLGAGGLRMFGGLSREDAVREAASAGGARWPGTSVTVRDEGAGRATVERRWLSMPESTMTIVEEPDGWYDGGSPSFGRGEAVQVALVCLVIPAIAGIATWRVVKRSRALLAPGGLGAR